MDAPSALIEAHVGSSTVVEVGGSPAVQAAVAAAADELGIGHRSAGTAVALFADEPGALAGHRGLDRADLDRRVARPANLEDVFVTLTGEFLR